MDHETPAPERIRFFDKCINLYATPLVGAAMFLYSMFYGPSLRDALTDALGVKVGIGLFLFLCLKAAITVEIKTKLKSISK